MLALVSPVFRRVVATAAMGARVLGAEWTQRRAIRSVQRPLVVISLILVGGMASGCGGSTPPRLLGVEEAARIVATEAGRDTSCVQWATADPEDSRDGGVWKCKMAKKEDCWSIRLEGTRWWGLLDDTPPSAEELFACPSSTLHPEPSGTESGNADPNGPEGDLATIELGSRPSSDDSTLDLISSLLDTMESDCPGNTRRELADYTANAYEKLNGAATPTEILQDVSMSTDLQAFSDCLDVFVQYVLLRQGGG